MSKIMRQLAAEGKAAREAAKAPKTAPTPPAPEPHETWPFYVEEEDALCAHGVSMTMTCWTCGRFYPPVSPPTPSP